MALCICHTWGLRKEGLDGSTLEPGQGGSGVHWCHLPACVRVLLSPAEHASELLEVVAYLMALRVSP